MYIASKIRFEELDLPAILYKYRKWSIPEHRRVLTNNEIHYESPFYYSEVHECDFDYDMSIVNDKTIRRYYYETAPTYGYQTRAEKRHIAKKLSKTSPVKDPIARQKSKMNVKQHLNNRLSIFSASEKKDSLGLWRNFAGGHTGFCVGFYTKLMFKNEEIFGGGGKVDYYDSPPKKNPYNFSEDERVAQMMDIIFGLPKLYMEEDEYRLTKIDLSNKSPKVPIKSIAKVILGAKMNEHAKEEIFKVVSERYPLCKLLQASFDEETQAFSFAPYVP